MDNFPGARSDWLCQRKDVISAGTPVGVVHHRIKSQSLLQGQGSVRLIINPPQMVVGTMSRTFITAIVYGIASKSAIVNSTSPRACMAASVSLISARRRDCISGCLASSSSAQLIVLDVVSCPAKRIKLYHYSNPLLVSCHTTRHALYSPHFCNQFFFRQLCLCIRIHIGFDCALIRFARPE